MFSVLVNSCVADMTIPHSSKEAKSETSRSTSPQKLKNYGGLVYEVIRFCKKPDFTFCFVSPFPYKLLVADFTQNFK